MASKNDEEAPQPPQFNALTKNRTFSITAEADCTIHYTTDGKDPTKDTAECKSGVVITVSPGRVVLKAISVRGGIASAVASQIIDPLLEITTCWACGTNLKDLPKKVSDLLSDLDSEALVEVFKILPRQLTQPHLDKFLVAEATRDATTVSRLLIATNFSDCGPYNPKLFRIISTAINRLYKHDTRTEYNVFEWRLRLCSMTTKEASDPELDLDAHARAAIIYALNTPNFLAFEMVFDSVCDVKTTRPETAKLISFVESVLLSGTGAKGYNAFIAKHGADFFDKLDARGALRKARLLSLCSFLTARVDPVPLAEVAQELLVDEPEAESIVIDAATANIIDAQIDPSMQAVRVKSVMPLRFDKKAFEELRRHIDANIAFIDSLEKSYGIIDRVT